jgi:DNA-binding protein HU-beta
MATPSAQEVVETMSRLIRERLLDGKTVHVPGLGTFSVEHRRSRLDPDTEDGAVMRPPKDEVHFEPEED